ncbi:hypothetical protein JL720_13031 [Aureococcus anophagefferens]|nr:hypothetical protein JL720_13031 [Aureococcus anophagefferens]
MMQTLMEATQSTQVCLNCDGKVIAGGGGDDVVSIGYLKDDYDDGPTMDLGDGDDTITIDEVKAADIKISGGDGDDNMHVKYMDFDTMLQSRGAGDDTITVDSYKGKGLSLRGGRRRRVHS